MQAAQLPGLVWLCQFLFFLTTCWGRCGYTSGGAAATAAVARSLALPHSLHPVQLPVTMQTLCLGPLLLLRPVMLLRL
jgi:hypothetical protein